MAFIPKEYSNTILALYLVSTVFAGASKYQYCGGHFFWDKNWTKHQGPYTQGDEG
jgi:hypothetical protein